MNNPIQLASMAYSGQCSASEVVHTDALDLAFAEASMMSLTVSSRPEGNRRHAVVGRSPSIGPRNTDSQDQQDRHDHHPTCGVRGEKTGLPGSKAVPQVLR